MKESTRDWIGVAAWAGLILLATTIPLPESPDTGPWPVDKVVHGGLYAGLGWLLARAVRRAGHWNAVGILGILSGGLVFAALDELHQRWIPTRAPDLGDWIADGVGLAVGVAAVAMVASARRRAGNGTPREAYPSPDGEGDVSAETSDPGGPGARALDMAENETEERS